MELERQVFHLRTLYEIAHALNSCRTGIEIHNQVLSILTGTLGVEVGIGLVSNQTGWRSIAVRGVSEDSAGDIDAFLLDCSFGEEPKERRKDLLCKFFADSLKRDTNQCAWVEFRGRERTHGGIFLTEKLSGDPFTATDHELLSAAASYTASAIENVSLYEELRDAKERLQLENIALREEVQREYEDGRVIGQSEGVLKILKQVRNIAKSPTNVLIYGETGTGKELIAKSIHYSSPRRDKPFVAVNCTAIPENLVESELFGIEAGVATGVKKHLGFFEQADGGTIFIDEIGDMPLSSQAKILRALQERTFRRVGAMKEISVDVRVIVATNKRLDEEMRSGNFREDLYFRLSVLEIHLPPLRQRRDDIPLLVNFFIKKIERKLDKRIKGFSSKAMKRLMEYDWPGNIRELENEVERAITLASDDTLLQPDDLSPKLSRAAGNVELPNALVADTLRGAVDKLEKHMIGEALSKYNWNKSEVSRQLGLSRLGLQKKLDRLGIRHQDGKE